MLSQVSYQVIGNDLAVTLAAEAGQLQLNAFEPLIVYNILSSMALLTEAAQTFNTLCVEGIEGVPAKCESILTSSTAFVTSLVPTIGYELAAALAKGLLETDGRLEEAASRA